MKITFNEDVLFRITSKAEEELMTVLHVFLLNQRSPLNAGFFLPARYCLNAPGERPVQRLNAR